MAKENKYNNFSEALEKEKNSTAQGHLEAFYSKYLGELMEGYEVYDIDYNDPYGQILQSAGVDKVFVKRNTYGSIEKQVWIQEKVCGANYPNFMFEYRKKSGADGWATDPDEKSKYIVFYHGGEITVFETNKLRTWLLDNLSNFKRKYKYKTDNYNVNIPKHIVKDALGVTSNQLGDYFNEE